jgi:uncharacterized membrane protein YbaN (DUF454 family)
MLGGLGWCAVGLAIAGVFVPGMPTTVFVISAAYCFSRSSSRFERWLRENALLGPFLHRVTNGSGMLRTAKRAALTAMWTAIAVSSVVLASVHWAAVAATIGLGVVGTLTILYGVRTAPELQDAPGLPYV